MYCTIDHIRQYQCTIPVRAGTRCSGRSLSNINQHAASTQGVQCQKLIEVYYLKNTCVCAATSKSIAAPEKR